MNSWIAKQGWSGFFLVAAFFNYVIGFPIPMAREHFKLSYVEATARDLMTLWLWADFGFTVILIGYGYQIVLRDVTRNRGIAILGIAAKPFDVVSLAAPYLQRMAKPVGRIPAAIDGRFTIAFVLFPLSNPPAESTRS